MSKQFEDHIQPGDEIIYSDSLECRVNMSQLRRVAKPDKEAIVDTIWGDIVFRGIPKLTRDDVKQWVELIAKQYDKRTD